MSNRGTLFLTVAFWFGGAFAQAAQVISNRYALVLEDPPAATRFTTREAAHSPAAVNYRRQIEVKQTRLRAELASRHITVAGAANTLVNAIFVVAGPERVPELKTLPGVIGVVPMRTQRLQLNRAVGVVNAPAAWTALGGMENAGRGVKIAIVDTGIDQTHPALQDASLPMPAGFPVCSGADCAFTSNKVIVARSYVRQLAAGSAPNPAADSRPDDYSPRDRVGHGTAVASCAAGAVNTGAVTFSGVAPEAYVGNYKVFGSPGVNGGASDDVLIAAVEDAFNDGMDIVSISSGQPALSGPSDAGAICGNNPGVPCDLVAQTFEAAAQKGLTIVAAAGNDGESGATTYPAYNSIESPGHAPSVISVGAITNAHVFLEAVKVPGPGVPAGLQTITARPGTAYVPPGPLTAPLRDVTALGDDGLACTALPPASLAGVFALIKSGSCTAAQKMGVAEDAGAAGVIFYMSEQTALAGPTGLSLFATPAVMISLNDGIALKNFIADNPEHPVTLDPAGVEEDAPGPSQLADFSSFGPPGGNSVVKPDLVAVGTDMYMATQNYDPNGEMYSSNRYVVAAGTSFSTPLVAGAAALVKQAHPNFTGPQVKSALVNTAAPGVTTDTFGFAVDTRGTGAGKLDAGAAVGATVTAAPTSVFFGFLTASAIPAARQIQVTNNGAAAANLAVAVAANNPSPTASVVADRQNLTLAPGASAPLTISLQGSLPRPGSYSGAVTLESSGGSILRVPFLYVVGNGVASNIIPLTGIDFDGTTGQGISEGILSFRLVDAYGAPVTGTPVTWSARGGGTIRDADSATDPNGVAAALPQLGTQAGTYTFTASAGGLRATFSGSARPQPAISRSGIANAASFDTSSPVAPGSYITIFGAGLSDFTDYATTARLPLSIDDVLVTFDVPSAGISVPGRLVYASPTQVNVQVPWELRGQSAAQVKVVVGYSYGNVVTLPLADYSPAFFEIASGVAAALDAGNRVVDANNPARRGQTVQLFANGLGPVTNQPESGEPAPASPLAQTASLPAVTIGGQPATLSFSGLAPGFAGLYQVNVTVPANAATGRQPLSVSIGGQTSKTSGIYVQ